jgi:hypothetical protein
MRWTGHRVSKPPSSPTPTCPSASSTRSDTRPATYSATSCPTSPDADHSEYDVEGGEAVGAGMDAVGDGSDPAPGPDPVERDEFVAGEPDGAGRHHPAEPGQWLEGGNG